MPGCSVRGQERGAQSIWVNVPEVVHFSVNQDDGNLFAVARTEFGILINVLFGEGTLAGGAAQFVEHTKHNDPGIITEMTARAAEQSYVGNDYFLLRRW